MHGKAPSVSRVEMVQQVLPGDTNPHGTVFGGKVMEWIDLAGAVAAMRHCQKPVVTASVDQIDFLAPARNGEIVVLKACVGYTGRTSIEVDVGCWAENPLTGKRVKTSDARVTYVAVDAKGRPVEVPQLLPESGEEEQRFEQGKERHRRHRMAQEKLSGT
jgi:acyl-CoA hydrolase